IPNTNELGHILFSPSTRRHTTSNRDWISDVCSSDLALITDPPAVAVRAVHDVAAPSVGKSGNCGKVISDTGRNEYLTRTLGGAVIQSENESFLSGTRGFTNDGINDLGSI